MKLSHLSLLVAAGIALGACTQQPTSQQDTSAPSADETMQDTGDSMDAIEGQGNLEGDGSSVESSQESGTTVSLEASNFTFGTEEIRVKRGTNLTVEITNVEGKHDFLIDELNIDTGLIPEGETVTVEIPTDQVGEFAYYCSVMQHRQLGMEGMLIIEE